MKSDHFLSAFKQTMGREGVESYDPYGGETYMGISRIHWPRWAGWTIIERVKHDHLQADINLLNSAVENFYLENFWYQIQGDAISEISPPVAFEVFDTSVNVGLYRGGVFLQDALNLLNNNQRLYPDLLTDGIIGKVTIETLRSYTELRPPTKDVAIDRLLRVLNSLQWSFYIELMRKNPEREVFRGWFDRI